MKVEKGTVCAHMYSLVDNKSFGTHTLELVARQPEVALFTFTFTSCLDREFSEAAR